MEKYELMDGKCEYLNWEKYGEVGNKNWLKQKM